MNKLNSQLRRAILNPFQNYSIDFLFKMGKTFSCVCFPSSSPKHKSLVSDDFILDQSTIRELQGRIKKHEQAKWTNEMDFLHENLAKSVHSIEKFLDTMNVLNISNNDAIQFWLRDQFYSGYLELGRLEKIIDGHEKQQNFKCNLIEIHRNKLISLLEQFIRVGKKNMEIGRKENERAEIGWLRNKIFEIDKIYEKMRRILVEFRRTWSKPVVLEFRAYQKELEEIKLLNQIGCTWWEEMSGIMAENLDFFDEKWSDWNIEEFNAAIIIFYLHSSLYVTLNYNFIVEEVNGIIRPLNTTLTYLDDMHKCYSYLIALFGQMDEHLAEMGNFEPFEQFQKLDLMKNSLKGCKMDLEFLQKINEKFANFPEFLTKQFPRQILNMKLGSEYSQKTMELFERHKALGTIVNWRWKN